MGCKSDGMSQRAIIVTEAAGGMRWVGRGMWEGERGSGLCYGSYKAEGIMHCSPTALSSYHVHSCTLHRLQHVLSYLV